MPPLIGGLLADHAGWRWTFYVNLPVGLAALLVIGARLRLPPRPAPFAAALRASSARDRSTWQDSR